MNMLALMISFWLSWPGYPDDSGVCWFTPEALGSECTVSSDGELGFSYRSEAEAKALTQQSAFDRLDGLCRRGGWDGVSGVGFAGPFCHLHQPTLVVIPLLGMMLRVTVDDGETYYWCIADALGSCYLGDPPDR